MKTESAVQELLAVMAKLRRGPWRASLVVQGRDKDVATASAYFGV